MAAGKNKLSRGVRVWVDDAAAGTARDLSGDLVPDSLSGLGFNADLIDMTGESEAVENGMGGRKKNNLKMKFHANDTASTGASTVLHGIEGVSEITVTVQIGDAGAAPEAGDLEWAGEYTCLSATLSQDGGRLTHECEFAPYGSTAPAWGTMS